MPKSDRLLRVSTPTAFPRLRLPGEIDRKGIVAGRAFAHSIRRLLQEPVCSLSEANRSTFLEIASLAERDAVTHFPRRHGIGINPFFGLFSDCPAYCALGDHEVAAKEAGLPGVPEYWANCWWIQVALLSWVAGEGPRIPGDSAKLLLGLVNVRTGSGWNADVERAIADIGARLRAGEPPTDPGTLTGLPKEFQSALEDALSLLVLPSVARRKKRPHRRSSPLVERNLKPPDRLARYLLGKAAKGLGLGTPGAIPVEDLVDEPDSLFIPLGWAIDDELDAEIGEPAQSTPSLPWADDGLPKDEAVQTMEEFEAERITGLHLSGALLPETDRTLLRPEANAINKALLARFEESLDRDHAAAALALGYGLTIATCRSLTDVWAGLSLLKSARVGHTDYSVFPDTGHFIARLPLKSELPNLNGSPWQAGNVHATAKLPLPALLVDCIERLLSSTSAQVLNKQMNVFTEQLAQLRQQMHAITPRFSEERLRTVLPIAIFRQSGDLCAAQIICGQRLDHSTAPLHYYVVPERYLIDLYNSAVDAAMPEFSGGRRERTTGSAVEHVGAPCALLSDDQVQQAIASLETTYANSARKTSSIERAIQAHNNLAVYTCAMFAAGTSHRLTYHLGITTAGDLLFDFVLTDQGPAGLAVIIDKLTDNGLSVRVVALAPILCRQLRIYLKSARELLQRLERGPRMQKTVVEQLNALVSGESALFQLVEYDEDRPQQTRLRRLRRKDIETAWPAWAPDIYLLRHRFATMARAQGLSSEDIRRQMGHVFDVMPFGESDLDDPWSFVRRVAKPIDTALSGDGWTVLGEFRARPQDVRSSPEEKQDRVVALPTEILNQEERWRRLASSRYKRYLVKLRRHAHQQGEEEQSRIDEVLLEAVPGYDRANPPRKVELSRSQVDQLAESLVDPDRHQTELIVATHLLRQRLRKHINHDDWKLSLPPVVHRRRVSLPSITVASVRAYHQMLDWLRWAESDPGSTRSARGISADRSPMPEALAVLVIELAARGGLVVPERLLAAIKAIPSARRHPHNPRSLIVEITPANLGDQESSALSSSVSISGAAAVMVDAWRRKGVRTSEITLSILEVALRRYGPPLLASIPEKANALEAVLQVAGLARRLTQIGARCAWEEGRLNSRTLAAERELYVRQNAIHPTLLPPAIDHDPDESEENTESGDAETKAQCRWLTQHVHAASVGARSKDLAGLRDRIEAHFLTVDNPSSTTRIFYHFTRGELERLMRHGGTARSLHTYLTLILSSTLEHSRSIGLLEMDEVQLLELAEAILHRPSKGNFARRVQTLSRFLATVRRHGGVEIDAADLAESAPLDGTDFDEPGYLISEAEYQWARGQLYHWAALSEQVSDRHGSHPADFRAAAQILTCQFRLGTRISESAHQRHKDLVICGDDTLMLVRPRHLRRLKSLASRRALSLRQSFTEDEYREFTDHLAEHRRFYKVEEASAMEVFVTPGSGHGRADRPLLGRLISLALQFVVDPRSARPHAGRHSVGSSALLHALPAELESAQGPIIGLSLLSAFAVLNALPSHLHFAFGSRRLGHAASDTTLRHYVHYLGLLIESDRGLPQPSAAALAHLAWESSGALYVAASKASLSVRTAPGHILMELLGFAADLDSPQLVSIAPPYFDDLPRVGRHAGFGPVLRTAMILRDIASGESLASIELRQGLPSGSLPAVISWLRMLGEQYRYAKLAIAQARGIETGSVKITGLPRWHRIVPLLNACDQEASVNPTNWNLFEQIVEFQQRFAGEIHVIDRKSADVVAQVLARVTRNSVFVIKRTELAAQEASFRMYVRRKKSRAASSRGARTATAFICLVIAARSRLGLPQAS